MTAPRVPPQRTGQPGGYRGRRHYPTVVPRSLSVTDGLRMAAAVLLVLAGVAGLGAGASTFVRIPWPNLDLSLFGGRPEAPASLPTLDRSAPLRVDIPAIDVHAPVIPVGKEEDGTLEVPPVHKKNETGWYVDGPSPGEPGSAVIVGHVDTNDSGPAVFHGLERLRPGRTVEVTRTDGRVAVFRIDSLERFPKNDFPTARVYGEAGASRLRLITCTGRYDDNRGEYLDNLVVFATLTGTR